jgi:hypothetical protein
MILNAALGPGTLDLFIKLMAGIFSYRFLFSSGCCTGQKGLGVIYDEVKSGS